MGAQKESKIGRSLTWGSERIIVENMFNLIMPIP